MTPPPFKFLRLGNVGVQLSPGLASATTSSAQGSLPVTAPTVWTKYVCIQWCQRSSIPGTLLLACMLSCPPDALGERLLFMRRGKGGILSLDNLKWWWLELAPVRKTLSFRCVLVWFCKGLGRVLGNPDWLECALECSAHVDSTCTPPTGSINPCKAVSSFHWDENKHSLAQQSHTVLRHPPPDAGCVSSHAYYSTSAVPACG